MKRFNNILRRLVSLILIVSIFSSLSSFAVETKNSLLDYIKLNPELINDGPGMELSAILGLNSYDLEILTDFSEEVETNIECWMFCEDYFEESLEIESKIECWMFCDGYFGESLEIESKIECWMLNEDYFKTKSNNDLKEQNKN